MTENRDRVSRALTFLKSMPWHTNEVRSGLYRIYNDVTLAASPIPAVHIVDIVGDTFDISLSNWSYVEGNVAPDELMFLCALARKSDAKVVVEIGTFDGNTTLQLALNTRADATIYTLDLPVGADSVPENAAGDAALIAATDRKSRRFVGTPFEQKIVQCYGNSMDYDFSTFTKAGSPQLIFIDAGHSYECVKNDTEKSLAILDKGGYIVWHDFGWPGVYSWLTELSSRLGLVRVRGTSMVVYHAKP